MTTLMDARVGTSPASLRSGRLGGICLALGGIAFLAGGAIHPGDTGGGTKVEQLYQAFVQPSWYPSHVLLLASFGLVAAAVLLFRTRGDLGPGMARLVDVVGVVAVVATLGMAVHLLSALGAGSIADGQPSLVSQVQTWNETILSTLWGLGIIALAVAGGLTGTLGNRITIPLAVVGGVAWCLAAATIAFTDRFDPLFPVAGSLISAWAVAAGAMWAVRRTTVAERPSTHVHERPARPSRQVMLALVLVVALAIGVAVMLTSLDDAATQNAPAADTDAVPAYTGDWKDSFIGGAAENNTLERRNEGPAYTGDWKDMFVDDGR